MKHFLSQDIFLKIYSFVGHNALYLDKSYYPYLIKLRKEFLNNPIILNYEIVKWKYSKNVGLINNTISKIRPTMIVKRVKKVKIYSNISIGRIINDEDNIFVPNKFVIIPSRKLKEKLIDPKLLLNKNTNYVDTRFISYDIFSMWSDDIERVKKYKNLWIDL